MPAEVIDFQAKHHGSEAVDELHKQLKSMNVELILAFFYALWCSPCRIMLEQEIGLPLVIEELDGRVVVCKIDVDKKKEENKGNIAVAGRYDVRGIPSLVLIKNGQEVDRIVGAVGGNKVLSAVKKYL